MRSLKLQSIRENDKRDCNYIKYNSPIIVRLGQAF